MSTFNHSDENNKGITFDATAKAHMLEMGRWTKFLAIFFWVVMALAVATGIIMVFIYFPALYADSNEEAYGIAVGLMVVVVMIVYAAVFFYPTWALYKYASMVKHAINSSDQYLFNKALQYLKNYFRYTGILIIVLTSLYIVSMLFTGFFAMLV